MAKGNKEVKLKVVEAFESQGLPSPLDFKEKVSAEDQQLAHVVIDHLYVGARNQLKIAKKELKNFAQDSDDPRFLTLREQVIAMIESVESAINTVAETTESIPNVDKLGEVVAKLEEEMKAAMLLSYTVDKKDVVLN